MKRLIFGVGALTAAVTLVVGLSSAPAASQSTSRVATLKVGRSGLGRILVDGRGHTLYLFLKDKRGVSACSGQCAEFWPPLITSAKPRPTAGITAALLGTTRKDGRLQVTYNHHPLYTFVQDTAPGQTHGEGLDEFGAEWYATSPAGAKVEDETGGSSGGYGSYGSH